jgi:hypothetical protein
LRKPEAITFNNRHAEVIENVSVDTSFSTLAKLNGIIEDILEVCYDAKVKLEAFL